jgi:hypothetical protein
VGQAPALPNLSIVETGNGRLPIREKWDRKVENQTRRKIFVKLFRAIAGSLLALALMPSQGLAETIYPSQLSAADVTSIDGLTKQTFDRIRGGKTLDALNQFFGNNALIKGKEAELKMLATQIDSLTGVYGAMDECRLAEEQVKVGLVVQRLYICRHGQYLTRWKLLFVNTMAGWSGANIAYDDKISLGLDE